MTLTLSAPSRYVAYYRVPAARQGRGGLGLEAQREAVPVYSAGNLGTLADEFTEVETGKNDDRPQLARAFDVCRLSGAVFVIAKLDRLSRDAHFRLGLEKAGVEFVAADMPNANRLTVRLMAVIAQEEREMISARTKAALAAAKALGTKLGGNRGGPKVNPALGTAPRRRAAEEHARQVGPTALAAWQAEGRTYGGAAAPLTARSICTPRGGKWTRAAVRSLIQRHLGRFPLRSTSPPPLRFRIAPHRWHHERRHPDLPRPGRNLRRYYRLDVQPDLFGAWQFIREWGRVGQAGQTLTVPYPTRHSAEATLDRQRRTKARRGYAATRAGRN